MDKLDPGFSNAQPLKSIGKPATPNPGVAPAPPKKESKKVDSQAIARDQAPPKTPAGKSQKSVDLGLENDQKIEHKLKDALKEARTIMTTSPWSQIAMGAAFMGAGPIVGLAAAEGAKKVSEMLDAKIKEKGNKSQKKELGDQIKEIEKSLKKDERAKEFLKQLHNMRKELNTMNFPLPEDQFGLLIRAIQKARDFAWKFLEKP